MLSPRWWQEAVLYQVYVRSFADGDGDGVGDLAGLRSRLDHLAWLGVDALWLSPTTPSPNADWGYDVCDYVGVDRELGTLAELDALVSEAGELGIRILLDLVPNHSSDRHPWFLESRSSRTSPKRDWYVWADPKPDGSPPNNWLSAFGGPAWTLDEATGQMYLHNFAPGQPDLNWWSEEVRAEFDRILRFWLDRGIAGFRIDVAHALVKDRLLRDDPVAGDSDHPVERRTGRRRLYSMNRPETHEIFRRWRALADAYEPERVLLGEVYVLDVDRLARYFGSGEDELHLAFVFQFLHSPLRAPRMRAIVAHVERALRDRGRPCWAGSNHDAGRFASRWAGDDPERARCGLLLLLALRGTPCLYQGDELGLPDTPLPAEDLLDVATPSRDPGRTPLPWEPGRNGGFTRADVRPWLPLGDPAAANVFDQRADPGSQLHLCRDLLALRRELADLRTGAYEELPSRGDAWAFRRGGRVVVALNLGPAEAEVAGVAGTIRICTRRERDGEQVEGTLRLGPWQGAVVEAPSPG